MTTPIFPAVGEDGKIRESHLPSRLSEVALTEKIESLAGVTQGKNLYNPSKDGLGFYLTDGGVQINAADYRTTDFIPVVPGESYAISVMRQMTFWDADKNFLPGSWSQVNPQAPVVKVAPEGAGFMRVSYTAATADPGAVQIEKSTTHTPYEPYRKDLDPSITLPQVSDLEDEISARPTIAEVTALVNDEVAASTEHFARVLTGKNLYQPATDTVGMYIADNQEFIFSGFRTTEFIPVVPGQQYALSVARHVNFYTPDKMFVPGGWAQWNPQQAQVVTAPEGAGFMRVSYGTATIDPGTVQIEQGAAHTPYEPYFRILDPTVTVTAGDPIGTGPVQVTRTGADLTISSMLGEKNLIQSASLSSGGNGLFNFLNTTHGGVTISSTSDDVAPIRTQQGTVGANHGLLTVGRWSAGTHDKTLADVGSVWTDGTTEYVILHINASGHIYIGRAYTTNSNGSVVSHSANPAADLTHVSGATHTATIPRASRVTDQLWPWVQRHRVVVEMDGRAVADGATSGRALTIRESYEILDYGTVYTWAKSHVGQPYTSVHHRAAVGVETEWIFHPGGKTRHRTRLWEISPTQLAACGFLQANAMSGDITRYLPGVGAVGGMDWDAGVPLVSLTANLLVASTHLMDSRHPPTVLVDRRSDVGMAVAVSPWRGASQSATRLAASSANLWDLRSTKKIYPTVITSLTPGWGHVEVEGIRAYLTPEEATAIVTDADPISAWVTLDQMSG